MVSGRLAWSGVMSTCDTHGSKYLQIPLIRVYRSSWNTMATLCLACSSSLPPRLWKQFQDGTKNGSTSASSSSGNEATLRASSELFLTQCCGRPICPSCLTSNPRLARYNPCLLCLGGMGVVDPRKVDRSLREQQQASLNVDGAVRDEDVFVVGEEDGEEQTPKRV
jgi:hypothetical protein